MAREMETVSRFLDSGNTSTEEQYDNEVVAPVENDKPLHPQYTMTDGKITKIQWTNDARETVKQETFRYDSDGNIERKEYRGPDNEILNIDRFKTDNNGHITQITHYDGDNRIIETEDITRSDNGDIVKIDHYTEDRYLIGRDLFEDRGLVSSESYDREMRIVDKSIYRADDQAPSIRQLIYQDSDGNTEFSKTKITNEDGKVVSDIRELHLENGSMIKIETSPSKFRVRAFDESGKVTDVLSIGKEISFKSFSEDRNGKTVTTENPIYIRDGRVVFGSVGNNDFFEKAIKLDEGESPQRGLASLYSEKTNEFAANIEQKYEFAREDSVMVGHPHRMEGYPEETFDKDGRIRDVTYYDDKGEPRYTESFRYGDDNSVRIEGSDLLENFRRYEEYDKNGICIESRIETEKGDRVQEDRIGTIVEENYPDYFSEKKTEISQDNVVRKEFYNENFKSVGTMSLDKEGNIISSSRIYYNNEGQISKQIFRDGKGEITERFVYRYDSENRLEAMEITDKDQNLMEETSYEYDEEGRLSSVTTYDAEGFILDKEEYLSEQEETRESESQPEQQEEGEREEASSENEPMEQTEEGEPESEEPAEENTQEENDAAEEVKPSEEISAESEENPEEDNSEERTEQEEITEDDEQKPEENTEDENDSLDGDAEQASDEETDIEEAEGDEPEYEQQDENSDNDYEDDKPDVVVSTEIVDGETVKTEVTYDADDNVAFIRVYEGEGETESLSREYTFVSDGTLVGDRIYDIETGRSKEDYASLGNNIEDMFPQYIRADKDETENPEQASFAEQTAESLPESNEPLNELVSEALPDNFETDIETVDGGSDDAASKASYYHTGGGDGVEYIDSTGDIRADEWKSDDRQSYSYIVYEEKSNACTELEYDNEEKSYSYTKLNNEGEPLREISIDASSEDISINVIDYEYDENGNLERKEYAFVDEENGTLYITNGITGETEVVELEGDNLNEQFGMKLADEMREAVEEIKDEISLSEEGISENPIINQEDSAEFRVDSEMERVEALLEEKYEEKRAEYEEHGEKLAEFEEKRGEHTYNEIKEELCDKYVSAMEKYEGTGETKYLIEAKNTLEEIKLIDSEYIEKEDAGELGEALTEAEAKTYTFLVEERIEMLQELNDLRESLGYEDALDEDEQESETDNESYDADYDFND